METSNLLKYMDTLRYSRKLNQENYLHGIVSQRQYYRYMYGESEPPFEIVLKLSEKLSLTVDRLIIKYCEEYEKDNKRAQEFFNHVINRRLSEAESIFCNFNLENIYNETVVDVILLGKALLDFYSHRTSKVQFISSIVELIQLHNLLKKDYLQDIEVYMLGIIMQYSDTHREKILERLIYLMKSSSLFNFGNRLLFTQTYFFIIKNLGRVNRLEDLIYISDLATEYMEKEHSYYLLADILYYKSIAFYKLDRVNEFEECIFELYPVLNLLSTKKKEYFIDALIKETDYNISDFYTHFKKTTN